MRHISTQVDITSDTSPNDATHNRWHLASRHLSFAFYLCFSLPLTIVPSVRQFHFSWRSCRPRRGALSRGISVHRAAPPSGARHQAASSLLRPSVRVLYVCVHTSVRYAHTLEEENARGQEKARRVPGPPRALPRCYRRRADSAAVSVCLFVFISPCDGRAICLSAGVSNA